MLSTASFLLLLPLAAAELYGTEQFPLNDIDYAELCPDYTKYSTYPQSVPL